MLVVRHEPDITHTTDVAAHPEFSGLRTTKTIDGRRITGWFTTDFTLAQLQTLRTVERLPREHPANTAYDGTWPIMTLKQVIDLARSLSAQLHRRIGVMPELKHPAYFRRLGLALEPRLLTILRANELTGERPVIPVCVQSFDAAVLRWLHRRVPVPLLQLVSDRTAPELVTAAGLRRVAGYARYVGAARDQLIAPGSATPTTLVRDAHAAGLRVLAYTFGDGGYASFLRLGVDGFFADDPGAAVAARTAWIAAGRPRA